MFVSGEAETDEPLLVKQSRRLLQQPHPPPVVLHQIVVGSQCRRDGALSFDGRKFHFDAPDAFRGGVPHLCATGTPGDLGTNTTRIEKIIQESLVEAILVQVHDTAESLVVEKSVRFRYPS